MQYRPDHSELVDAIQEFLIKEILPYVKDQDALAYKTLVSWNMLGVVSRELKHGRPLLENDAEILSRLAGESAPSLTTGDRELMANLHVLAKKAAQALRASKALPGGSEWKSVKELLKNNLQISNPRYGTDS
jgi:hypothetical protein